MNKSPSPKKIKFPFPKDTFNENSGDEDPEKRRITPFMHLKAKKEIPYRRTLNLPTTPAPLSTLDHLLSKSVLKDLNFEDESFQTNKQNSPSSPQPKPRPTNEDFSLVSTMTERLSVIEQNLLQKKKKLYKQKYLLKEKDNEIHRLREENSKLKEKTQKIYQNNNLLSSQNEEFLSFLQDHGLEWVGEDNNSTSPSEDKGTNCEKHEINEEMKIHQENFQKNNASYASQALGFTFDMTVIKKNIRELNIICGKEIHQVITSRDGSSRLQIADPVPLTFYRNGIFLMNGPFRNFNKPSVRVFVRDLMDGYFPTELRDMAPGGCPLELTTDMYDKDYVDGTTQSPHLSHHNHNHNHHVDHASGSESSLLGKIPPMVIKNGTIIPVQSLVRDRLNKTHSPMFDYHHIPSPELTKNNNVIKLRIKHPSAGASFELELNTHDTIFHIRTLIERYCSNNEKLRPCVVPGNYELKTIYPDVFYKEYNKTLLQVGITNDTIMMIVGK